MGVNIQLRRERLRSLCTCALFVALYQWVAIGSAVASADHGGEALTFAEEAAAATLQADRDTLRAKPWPAEAGRTILAWTSATPSDKKAKKGSEGQAFDIGLAVIRSTDGKVLASHVFHRALDLDPTQAPDLLDIDTARYSLAPGVMAFGIRTGSQHQGVASYSDSRLGLYVIDGRDIRQVLDLSVSSSFQMSDSCDEWRDTRRTVAIGDRPAGGGFADLVVTETSSSAKPDKRNESGCEFVASKERSRWVLHYDGRTYPPPPKER